MAPLCSPDSSIADRSAITAVLTKHPAWTIETSQHPLKARERVVFRADDDPTQVEIVPKYDALADAQSGWRVQRQRSAYADPEVVESQAGTFEEALDVVEDQLTRLE